MAKITTPKTKKRFSKRVKTELGEFKKNAPMTILALPAIIVIFIFNYLPLYGLVLPFQKYSPALGFSKAPGADLKTSSSYLKRVQYGRRYLIRLRTI